MISSLQMCCVLRSNITIQILILTQNLHLYSPTKYHQCRYGIVDYKMVNVTTSNVDCPIWCASCKLCPPNTHTLLQTLLTSLWLQEYFPLMSTWLLIVGNCLARAYSGNLSALKKEDFKFFVWGHGFGMPLFEFWVVVYSLEQSKLPQPLQMLTSNNDNTIVAPYPILY